MRISPRGMAVAVLAMSITSLSPAAAISHDPHRPVCKGERDFACWYTDRDGNWHYCHEWENYACKTKGDSVGVAALPTVGENFDGLVVTLYSDTERSEVAGVDGVVTATTTTGTGTSGRCGFQAASTENGSVVLTVEGDAGSGPGALATQVECVVLNGRGEHVASLTYAQSGPTASGSTVATTDNYGGYSICGRARSWFAGGEAVQWPGTSGNYPTPDGYGMACAYGG